MYNCSNACLVCLVGCLSLYSHSAGHFVDYLLAMGVMKKRDEVEPSRRASANIQATIFSSLVQSNGGGGFVPYQTRNLYHQKPILAKEEKSGDIAHVITHQISPYPCVSVHLVSTLVAFSHPPPGSAFTCQTLAQIQGT